jgi:hypothetical protein
MRDELFLDLRRTQLLAVDSNLDDARRALFRAARIPTIFAAELRRILATVADLEHRVLASTESSTPPTPSGAAAVADTTDVPRTGSGFE